MPAFAASPVSFPVIAPTAAPAAAPRARAPLPVTGACCAGGGGAAGFEGSMPVCCVAHVEHAASSFFCWSGDCPFAG